ncbi:MAG TPA: DJ-1/PfpI family protein [Pyrinomonadaceae bacterium]|nr:DJ-1/PfpI family protein [Pyrinomonadaceae bacterium]
MKRRDFIKSSAAAGAVVAASGITQALEDKPKTGGAATSATARRLAAPAKGRINVAFVISQHATVIDFAGPWEVFQDVHVPSRGAGHEEQMPFQLYTVSEKTEPLRATAGLQLIPDYTFADAPAPKVVVVGAQAGRSAAMYEWLKRQAREADVLMSVCTGAFHLARAGLLDGREATTHHDFTARLRQEFPAIKVREGLRFIEGERISTSGGLTSGIDLSLRVVERYFGRDVAAATARYMEYQSTGWMV